MNTFLKPALLAATLFGAASVLAACGEEEAAEAPATMEEGAETMSTPETEDQGMMEEMGEAMDDAGEAMKEGAENFAEDVEEAAENMEEAAEEGEADHGSEDAPVPPKQAE